MPYEILAGATAAVDFIAAIDPGDGQTRRARLHNSWDAIHAHEARLLASLEAGLADLAPEVEIHSRAQSRTPTLLLTLQNRSTRDAYEFLAARKVLAPAGSFYAYEPFRRLEPTTTAACGSGSRHTAPRTTSAACLTGSRTSLPLAACVLVVHRALTSCVGTDSDARVPLACHSRDQPRWKSAEIARIAGTEANVLMKIASRERVTARSYLTA